jgi:predicted metal-dependent hydrolase
MRKLLDFLYPQTSSPQTHLTIIVDGASLDVDLKRNPRSRRMTLRMTRSGDGASLSLPRRTSLTEAKAFLQRSTPWLADQLKKHPTVIRFADGVDIPVRGVAHRIVATGGSRGIIGCEAATVSVPGRAEHVPRRVTDWLKAEALRDIKAAVDLYATKMNVTARRISIRDQKSRWGSCSSTGDLSFSWRLILAPPYVLDYVAAHEVAHLLEMNHSPRFWRHVIKHCPRCKDAKNWMKANGGALHRFV